MPRISAGTVAEHRARQRQVLLAAARDLLVDGGYPALTFAALARRAGLARPSVYAYFRTREEVVVALCEVELPAVGAEVVRAVADGEPTGPAGGLRQGPVGRGRRRSVPARARLADAPLSTSARAHIAGCTGSSSRTPSRSSPSWATRDPRRRPAAAGPAHHGGDGHRRRRPRRPGGRGDGGHRPRRPGALIASLAPPGPRTRPVGVRRRPRQTTCKLWLITTMFNGFGDTRGHRGGRRSGMYRGLADWERNDTSVTIPMFSPHGPT